MSELSKGYLLLFNGITDLKSEIDVATNQLRQLQINSEESFVDTSVENAVSKEYSILFNGISNVIEELNNIGQKMDHLQVKAEDDFLENSNCSNLSTNINKT